MASKTALQAHGLSTKFLPLFFLLIAFLYISDYTRDSVAFVDPTDFFIAIILGFAGLIFIYEGINNIPRKGTTTGTAGFIFFFLFAVINFGFAIAIFYDVYQPLADTGDINLFLQIVVGVNMVMFLVQGIYEIYLQKRFVVEKVF